MQAGDGGYASAYSFDPATGLSNDPQLAYYLQNLTPSQLQTALNGGDPTADITNLLVQEATATGAGALPCGGPNNPSCAPVATGTGIPSWVLWTGAGVGALLVIGGLRK